MEQSLRQLLSGGNGNGEAEDEFINHERAGNVGDRDQAPDNPLPDLPEEDESWHVVKRDSFRHISDMVGVSGWVLLLSHFDQLFSNVCSTLPDYSKENVDDGAVLDVNLRRLIEDLYTSMYTSCHVQDRLGTDCDSTWTGWTEQDW